MITTSEYEHALATAGLTDRDLDVLRAFVAEPDHSLTATELGIALGSTTYRTGNLAMGHLGRALAEAMPQVPLPSRPDGRPHYWAIIATGSTRASDGHFLWTMHASLVTAVRRRRT